MLTWTIEQYQKKSRLREVTVNLEGKVTSRDCPGIFTLCFDKYSRCDHLVIDLTLVEEKDGSIPVLICCLRKTAGLAEGRISLRGIPPVQPGSTTDYMSTSEGPVCGSHNDCECTVSRLAHRALTVGTWHGDAS